MKNNSIVKINKMGKVGHIIAKVLRILVIIAISAVSIAFIACAVLPKDLVSVRIDGQAEVIVDIGTFGTTIPEKDQGKITEKFEDGGYASFDMNGAEYRLDSIEATDTEVKVDASAKGISFNLSNILAPLFTVILTLVMTLITINFADKVCKAFRDCLTPFEENVIVNMRKFAFSLIPWAVLSNLSSSAVKALYTGDFDIFIGVDIGMVAIVLVLLALTYIFKYGAELQKESDETL